MGGISAACRVAMQFIKKALVTLMLALTAMGAAYGEVAIELKPYAGKLRQVTVRIANRDHQFLFDTAGGHTIISPALAAAIGCTPSGRSVGFRMSGEKFGTPLCADVRLAIGAFTPDPQTVGVFDLMSLLPKELPPVDGLISLKSFTGRSVALDLGANRLIIFPRRIKLQRHRIFRCRAATGPDGSEYTLFAALRGRRQHYWFEIDSANLDKVLVAPHAAADFGLKTGSADSTGTVRISLGATPPVEAAARVADIIYDGALNAAFLEQGVLKANLTHSPSCGWHPHPTADPQAGGKGDN